MTSGKVLIIGGGPAGLEAARCVAGLGEEVIILEKRERLGGTPDRENYAKLTHHWRDASEAMTELAMSVMGNPSVEVKYQAEVKSLSGEAGDFEVQLETSGVAESLNVGAIIVATGFQHFDPGRATQYYNYYSFPDVITLTGLDEKADAPTFPVRLTIDGAELTVDEQLVLHSFQRASAAAGLDRRSLWLGNFKLAVVIVFFVAGAFYVKQHAFSPYWLLLPVIAFFVFVIIHDRVIKSRRASERAAEFYRFGLDRIADRWAGAGDPGDGNKATQGKKGDRNLPPLLFEMQKKYPKQKYVDSGTFYVGEKGVKVIGTGWVASAGALIYAAAPVKQRFSLPNTRFLLHQPLGGIRGSAQDLAIEAQEILSDPEIASHLKMIYIETPANPTNSMVDIEACARLARHYSTPERQVLVAVDNTFLGPLWQHPLAHGADLVLYSATKYIGGHSDLLGGALVVKDPELLKRLYFIQNATGAVLGPLEAFLCSRGLKTLELRVLEQGRTAARLAKFLAADRRVHVGRVPGQQRPPLERPWIGTLEGANQSRRSRAGERIESLRAPVEPEHHRDEIQNAVN